jgi:hypothetical protein
VIRRCPTCCRFKLLTERGRYVYSCISTVYTLYQTRTQRNFYVSFCLRSTVLFIHHPSFVKYVWLVVYGEKLFRSCVRPPSTRTEVASAAAGSPKMTWFFMSAVLAVVFMSVYHNNIPIGYHNILLINLFITNLGLITRYNVV